MTGEIAKARGHDFMREMRAGEETQVEQLLQKAFKGNDEARLVRLLRKEGVMAGESVVAEDGRIGEEEVRQRG